MGRIFGRPTQTWGHHFPATCATAAATTVGCLVGGWVLKIGSSKLETWMWALWLSIVIWLLWLCDWNDVHTLDEDHCCTNATQETLWAPSNPMSASRSAYTSAPCHFDLLYHTHTHTICCVQVYAIQSEEVCVCVCVGCVQNPRIKENEHLLGTMKKVDKVGMQI